MSAADGDIKVTVIVPFLNAEATIARCAHSILSQSLKEMEVIFVNDGSRDNSFFILNEVLLHYPDKIDSTRVLYYTYRRGVAEANKVAMREARGRYIIRCDADDEFIPEALTLLVDEADRTGADVIAAPYIRHAGNSDTTIALDRRFPDINRMKLTIDNYGLWNKLLRRDMLTARDIAPYQGIDCWDDLVILARVFALDPLVATIGQPVYRHYISPKAKTLSNAPRDTALRQHLLAALRLEQWFTANNLTERYQPFLDRLKLIAKVKFLRGRGKDIAAWKSTFPEVNRRCLSITLVPFHYRILMKLVAILPTRLTQYVADQLDRLKN